MELWVGCIAGALEETEYRRFLNAAGFNSIDIEPTRVYRLDDAEAFLTGSGLDRATVSSDIDGRFMSAFIRATKPAEARACCGSECCS
jgi:hypothetical protein